MRVAIVAPYAPTFLHFRGPLVRYLREQGHDLVLLAPDWTPDLRRIVEHSTQGSAEAYPLDRTGVNPLGDLKTLAALTSSFIRLRPQVVLTFQPKPNVYGILAAALARVPLRAAVVEGLGFAFTPGEDTLKKRLVRAVLKVLYRLSFAFAHKVFFLNPDDLKEFVSQGLVRPEKAVLLGGIGVPLEEWPPAPPHLEPLTFTLIAWLLREKGVQEFVKSTERSEKYAPPLPYHPR